MIPQMLDQVSLEFQALHTIFYITQYFGGIPALLGKCQPLQEVKPDRFFKAALCLRSSPFEHIEKEIKH